MNNINFLFIYNNKNIQIEKIHESPYVMTLPLIILSIGAIFAGYLSKDLINMTQEKMIQAFGRVGRKGAQSDYTLRIRDNALIEKLYTKEENKPEVRNMNRLFT